MSVLWVHPVSKGGGQGDGGANFFSTQYLIKTNDPSELRVAVLNCGLLPVYGSVHPENLAATCNHIEVHRSRIDPLFWDGEAQWSTVTGSGRDPSDQQLPPDMRRPIWSARFLAVPFARLTDNDGKLFVDKAGTPFDPPPDTPIYVDEVTIQRYEATCNRTFQRGYMGKSNSDAWQSAEAGTVLVDNIVPQEEYIQGAHWYRTTYTLLHKPRIQVTMPKGTTYNLGGWDPEIIANAGPLQLVWDSVSSKYTKKPVTHGGYYDGRPALLDEHGAQIDINETTGELASDPTFLQASIHSRVPFSSLQLYPPPGWTGI